MALEIARLDAARCRILAFMRVLLFFIMLVLLVVAWGVLRGFGVFEIVLTCLIYIYVFRKVRKIWGGVVVSMAERNQRRQQRATGAGSEV